MLGEHINENGEFVSDLVPGTPPNFIPIKISAKTSPYLWELSYVYDQDRPIFAGDLRTAIINAGFSPV